MYYYPGAIMHNRCRMIVYTVFQLLGLGWWFFMMAFGFALAWGGFHTTFALIFFLCSMANWVTCLLGLVAGLMVLGCSNPSNATSIEMSEQDSLD